MTDHTPSAEPDVAARRRLPGTGLALLAFVAVLAVAMAVTGWTEARDAILALGPWKLLGLCALAGAHYLLRAVRWHLIVRSGGIGTRFSQSLRHYFGGFAMTATPGRVGEIVRLRWLKLETGLGYTRLLPAAFADRAIELAAIVLVIGGALALAGLGSAAAWWVVAVAGLLVGIACRPRTLEAGLGLVWRLSRGRKTRLFVKLRRMTRDLTPFMRPAVAGPALGLGILGWALEGVAFWALLSWLGADVGLAAATAIFLVSVLSGTLSGLPGGLGGTEATAVALLILKGVAPETAILATAIIRITTLWFAVGIGFLVFPTAEMRAAAQARVRAA
jgi:glycosyltransferase 2 family protein